MTAEPAETLRDIGETAVLQRIFPRLPQADAALVGPGDDAAVIAAPDSRIVITTDTMVHGPDFRTAWSTPYDLGWKAAATNLADVAAMGATPTALVVALTIPADTPVADLEAFADGMREACAALARGCGVVGGDLGVSPTFTIAVTAIGDLVGGDPVLRSGARPGDVVAVAGQLGLAAKGLALLFARGVDREGVPDARRARNLRSRFPAEVSAQLAPRPPIYAGPVAALSGATAMLDVSDGLLLDARRIAQASGVTIDLATEGTGVAEVLHGGEDHALLACFPGTADVPPPFRVIGRVLPVAPGSDPGVTVDGAAADERGGWDPYAEWAGGAG
ncbi:thiamine-phosphate kinase [Schumannella soli]|uniref:Thiamine-monophosphate kinase n=1 Tax=Schumannella soli TaxID=2590779 RepID=A0A506Y3K7_9MICO|nr:thiamine-phosphate kinase [Schumannella soli]TPW75019.1 thiamine-phosphate kinase [Schumannella soli]